MVSIENEKNDSASRPAKARRAGIAAVGTLLPFLLTIAGCSSHNTAPRVVSRLAVVEGVHANAPAGMNLTAAFSKAIDEQGDVTLIEVDGAPYVVATAQLTSQAKNGTARAEEKNRLLNQLQQAATAATPRTPQTDLLAAVTLASRYLGSSGARALVISDSGLQTTGVLRFQEPGMLDAEPRNVTAMLARFKTLPDLRGVTAVLGGIGDTAPPQNTLTEPERTDLINVWVSILRSAGANVTVSRTPREGASPRNAPAVTPVLVQPLVLHLPPPRQHTSGAKVAVPPPSDPVPLPAAAFFTPDEATLIDPTAAAATLKRFAERAVAAGQTINLVGTTARWGSKEGQIELSRQRAKTIAELLIDHLKVPKSQVTYKGVGSYWPGYENDHDASGTLLPGPAALNRTVQISFSGGSAR
jgi:outer membrane protein OmpA-like peptidoglycan-associated protein